MAFPMMTSIAKLPPWMLLGVGVITGYLKSIWSWIYDHTFGWVVNKISVSLTVEEFEHAEAYSWLASWVEKHLRARKVSELLLRKKKGEDKIPSSYYDYDSNESDESGSDYDLMPHYGSYHMLWQKRYPMVVTHFKENADRNAATQVRRTITLRIWGRRDRAVLLNVLTEACEEYAREHPERFQFFMPSTYNDGWRKVRSSERSLDSLYFPNGLIDSILMDARTFLQSREKYARIGIPYRRGYLFEGPPGTGKSTIVQAMASNLAIPIYSMTVGSNTSGEDISRLIEWTKTPSILLFEDIDSLSITQSRENDNSKTEQSGILKSLKLSDLLNAIDGIGAGENRIVIMTTNYPDNLDPALIRSGRIDRVFHFGYAEDTELRQFHSVVSEYFPVAPWPEFRSALPVKATIADAQSLAFRGTVTTSF